VEVEPEECSETESYDEGDPGADLCSRRVLLTKKVTDAEETF
jgi:hypothetical protein